MRLFFLVIVVVLNIQGSSLAGTCYEASIVSPTPFMGNSGEIFKLSDGSFWEVKFEYEYMYSYYPSVLVCPEKSKLIIGDKSLNISLINKGAASASSKQDQQAVKNQLKGDVLETRIDGDFNGWSGDTIVRTIDGRVWQQAASYIEIHIAINPEVTIFRTNDVLKMQVEGIKKPVRVLQLK